MASRLLLPSVAMHPDDNALLVAGDLAALWRAHVGRLVLGFDATDEMAAVTPEIPMPSQYTGSGLKAVLYFYMESDATNDVALDVFVEAKTPDGDTLDMETADDWDSANSGTKSLAGTTAGDLLKLEITLTNDDGLNAGDLVRFGVRRDTDSANDDATGELFLAAIEIVDDG